MPKKNKEKSATAKIRTVNQLIQDLNIIYHDCGGKDVEKDDGGDQKLDEFQRTKKELADIMKMTKADIKTQKGIQERVGNNAEAIKLKQKIGKSLDEAKRLHSRLEDAYKQDKHRAEQGKVE